MKDEIFRIENVNKSISGVKVLDGFRLNVFKGEIVGLFGLNSLAFSCLQDVLCARTDFDFGKVYFKERLIKPYEYKQLFNKHIYSIDNDSKLFEDFSIADNLFVLRKGFSKHIVNAKVLTIQTNMLLSEINLALDPKTKVRELSLINKYLIELVKAVVSGAYVVIINEIFHNISALELNVFNDVIERYRKKGISFIIICNNDNTLLQLCDRLTVVKDGKNVRTFFDGEYNHSTIMQCLMGKQYQLENHQTNTIKEETILEFKHYTSNKLSDISFDIKKGEIVSALGVLGNNHLEIVEQLYKKEIVYDGDILYLNKPFKPKSMADNIEDGIGIIPDKRLYSQYFTCLSVLDNLSFLVEKKLNKFYLSKRIKKYVYQEFKDKIDFNPVKVNDEISDEIRYKAVYYRWLLYQPNLLVCVKPLSGADVIHKKLILNLINEITQKGISVLILSSNISEAFELSDKVVLIKGNQMVKIYNGQDKNFFKSELFAKDYFIN